MVIYKFMNSRSLHFHFELRGEGGEDKVSLITPKKYKVTVYQIKG